MTYLENLQSAVRQSKSVLCVGLDPNPGLIPDHLHKQFDTVEETIEFFLKEVIDATQDYCCAYKPNLAFFEALGAGGFELFQRILDVIPEKKILISDAKRGDIGSTGEQYKTAFFDRFDSDALTLNPLMGFDTLDPFMQDEERAIYPLVLTSNPGSHDLLLRRFEGRLTLAEYIASQLFRKAESGKTHIGMVVGATYPQDMMDVIAAYPTASLLIPGVGSQGGSVRELDRVLKSHKGIPIISSSRSILYAGSGTDWKDAVAGQASKLKTELQTISDRYS